MKNYTKSEPNDSDGWTLLAFTYRKLEKYQASEESYVKALNIDPENMKLTIEFNNENFIFELWKLVIQAKIEEFLNNWDQNQNIIFVTHYVVISEILNYAPSSGEIVISDKSLKVIDTLEIEY